MASSIPPPQRILSDAIGKAKQAQLRTALREVCDKNEAARHLIRDVLLTTVAIYENGDIVGSTEDPEEDADYDDGDILPEEPECDDKYVEAAIAAEDDDREWKLEQMPVDFPTPTGLSHLAAMKDLSGNAQTKKRKIECLRYHTCDQCKEEFDLNINDTNQCIYHPEERELHSDYIYGDDDWDNPPDEVVHPIERFVWPCCERRGDETGCKIGPHRTRDFSTILKKAGAQQASMLKRKRADED